jgi:hypothetical protein
MIITLFRDYAGLPAAHYTKPSALQHSGSKHRERG